MTIRSGLNASVGFAEEVTYGVPVAPSRHLPVLPGQFSMDSAPEIIQSEAILAGARLPRSSQWSLGRTRASLDLGFEVYDRAIGLLFKHMFGTVGTTGAGPYTHTFTPGDLEGDSLTFQLGIPDVDTGVVKPWTFSGSKIEEWELACMEGEIATLGLTIASKNAIIHRTVTDGATTVTSTAITSATAAFNQDDVGKPISGTGIPAGATIASFQSATAATLSAAATATATGLTFTFGLALTSVSYPANITPMTFLGASVTIAGSSYRTKDITLTGNNGLNTDRGFLGEQGRGEPLEAGLREYKGTINSDYWTDAAYRRFVAGTEAALVFAIQRGTSTITITCNVRFDGSTPSINGTDLVQQELPFTCIGTSTDATAITAVLVNADATP